MIDVRTFGALGDGAHDDGPALQKAIDAGEEIFIPAGEEIFIPAGHYIVHRALRLPSGRRILADQTATITFVAVRPMTQDDFLITNADTRGGNADIAIEGGVWDGGFGRPLNDKGGEIFKINSSSGACMNFINVTNLTLKGLTVANPVGYYIRMGGVRHFEIRDICFASERRGPNQDGVHMGGCCFDGLVENVRAITDGQTNDDLLAFNADDSIQRQENRGLTAGPIEDVTCRNIYAENCHTAIRFASVTSPIRRIRIENLYAGCRCMAINMDAARYCKTPLFLEAAAPGGVGDVSDVVIRDMTAFFTDDAQESPVALIDVEEHADAFTIERFSRPMDRDRRPNAPTILARNLTHQAIACDGTEYRVTRKDQTETVMGDARTISLTRLNG